MQILIINSIFGRQYNYETSIINIHITNKRPGMSEID